MRSLLFRLKQVSLVLACCLISVMWFIHFKGFRLRKFLVRILVRPRVGIFLIAVAATIMSLTWSPVEMVTAQESHTFCHMVPNPDSKNQAWARAHEIKACSDTVITETLGVGVTGPQLVSNWAWGPGAFYAFDGETPTKLQFGGWVRPRVSLENLRIGGMAQPGSALSGKLKGIGFGLAWDYLAWHVAGFAVLAWIVLIMFHYMMVELNWVPALTVRRMWHLLKWGVIVALLIGIMGFLNMIREIPETVGQIHGLADVVSADPLPAGVGFAQVPRIPQARVVVMGDSTFAEPGLPGDTSSSIAEHCHRSYLSWPSDLANANPDWGMLNLSCSGATIDAGILNEQNTNSPNPGGPWVPAQLDEAEADTKAKVIVLGVGADDVGWSAAVAVCTKTPFCNDPLTDQIFQHSLNQLEMEQVDLYSDLESWPINPAPHVLVVLYYNPFGRDLSCLKGTGLAIPQKLAELSHRVDQLNDEIANSAEAFGFATMKVNFSASPLCSSNSYVQGPYDPEPFHPTVTGATVMAIQIGETLERDWPQLFPAVVSAGS